ncbi:MAG: energy transducer TonB [Candidatus Acidiferrales bacterium]
MQQAVKRARDRNQAPIIEVVSRARSAPVKLGVEWGSRAEEFRSSLREFFTGPRPSKTAESGVDSLKVEFIEPHVPVRGFLASCLWHVAAIWLLILPIWGFLPKVRPTLQPPQIEMTWYTTPADLPKILLPSATPRSKAVTRKVNLAAKSAPAAEAYHPRQTILSIPVHETHPRQTLIQPKAPLEPPKVVPNLPNMVQWTTSEPPKLQLQLSASNAAPRIERRQIQNAAAPEISDATENGARLDLLANEVPKRLAMPLSAATAVAVARHRASTSRAQAPVIRENSESDANLGQLIALSATPALAAPRVKVPAGNLAARIAMSPTGRKSGTRGGSASGTQSIASNSAMKGGGTLPAAISISGGSSRAKNGEMHSPGNFRRDLGLTTFSRADADTLRRSAPARIDVAHINPSLPPETVFSGRQVYTMNISMPNVTSASGSWILNFAQLDTGDGSAMQHLGALSGPSPMVKVDPKYPSEMIREHVQGEVVLYAIIRKNGSVDSIRVMRSLDPQLDRDAAAALAEWKFRPGMRAGVPVDIEAVVHIPFNYAVPTK